MPRICTTVDGDLDRRLSAEARRRRITRARLLREAAIHYVGAADGMHAAAELQWTIRELRARLERLERQLDGRPESGDAIASPSPGSADGRG